MRLSYEKAKKYAKSGRVLWMVWGHVHSNRRDMNEPERLEFYARSQCFHGKQKHYQGEAGHTLNGAYGGYFTSQKQAQKFADEILEGLHPDILQASRDWEYECDAMDECMGICDRGLGFYQESS